MINKIKYKIFFLLYLFFFTFTYPQENSIEQNNNLNFEISQNQIEQQNTNAIQHENFPPIKLIADTNYPVKSVTFNNKNNYAYSISDTIVICNTYTDEVEKVILGHTGQIQHIYFFDYEETYLIEEETITETINSIISYDNNNFAYIFDVSTKMQKAKLEYNPLIKLNTISNYKNQNIIAGLDDGNIILTNLNRENNNQQLIKISESSILNIEYSKDGKTILITAKDGNIYLISSENFSTILHVFGYKEISTGAKFNKNSNSILYQSSTNKLTSRSIDGIPLFDIEVPKEITNFIWSKNGNKIYVATSNSMIWIYSSSGILEGAIFAESPEKIISMDTNLSETFLLVGFEEGSLIKIFIKQKFILPDDAIQMQKELDEIEKHNNSELENIQETKNKEKKIELPIEDFALEINLGMNTLPEPYTISIFAGLRYIEIELLHPISLGVGLNYYFGFPQKDFPYKYYLNSREFHPPFLSEFNPYLSIGYNLAPIKNFDFLLTADVKLGIGLMQLWSANLAANLSGKIIPTLYASLGISASIYNWGLHIAGEYNTCLGFGFTTSAFYRFDFTRRKNR